jgi:hypothetical protein|tara:strand:+ start:2827 stop:3687 length:861 start_codon:yes stop_codon:yes gene_type:complete
MIGFNHLGTMGRFGNQMFQYATLKGIARNRGFDFCIPPELGTSRQQHNYGLFDAYEMSGVSNVQFLNNGHAPVVRERFFHFDEELFKLCPDHVSILGFFQTEKYFKHIETEIRKDFTFRDNWLKPCQEFMSQFEGEEIGFVHIRRGDPTLDDNGFKWAYTECSDQHPPQPISYYEKALKKFPEDMKFLVFSDSIDWCKEQEIFKSDRFMFSEPEDKFSDGSFMPYIDVCLMSLCSHAIIPNSSLSWWGAWLQKNPNKKIISPKMWFGPAYHFHDTKDLIPEEWERI